MSRGSSRTGRATGKAPQGKSTVTRNRTETAATRRPCPLRRSAMS